MMGLSRWMHWTAWYFKYFIFLFISCSIMTLLLCVKFVQNIAVINSSHPSLILTWLLLYTMNTISFCFLISTIFSKGKYFYYFKHCFLTFMQCINAVKIYLKGCRFLTKLLCKKGNFGVVNIPLYVGCSVS